MGPTVTVHAPGESVLPMTIHSGGDAATFAALLELRN